MNAKVYKHYTAEQLDQQYNNRAAVPDHEQYFERWKQKSVQAREQFGMREDVAYGTGDRETLDIFPAQTSNAPVVVFLHGGYWQALDKTYFSFIAPPLLQQGHTVAVVNYPLCPAAKLSAVVTSLRWALIYLLRNLHRFNGDAGRIYLVGHSAGGHLAAMLLATHWDVLDSALNSSIVQHAVCISGLFELEPLRHTYVNQALNLDQEACLQLSPIFLPPPPSGSVSLYVGGEESDEYKRQSEQLVQAWSGPQFALRNQVLDGHNHFSILDELTTTEGKILTAIGGGYE